MNGVRFAPSPTGVFHVGNLRTAWIAWKISRLLTEPWIVRFEDIDRPRVVEGAREKQLADLAALGVVPDLIVTQSGFHARHLSAFERAVAEGAVYACTCSRKEVQAALAEAASAPHGTAALYSGRCRPGNGGAAPEKASPSTMIAWRFKMPNESGADDFIVARAAADTTGFTPAYNWACALDDLDGDYSLIVRASDLASVLGQQRAIQELAASWRCGGEPPCLDARGGLPAAFHCALITQDSGERLEKRTRGVVLDELRAAGRSVESLVSCFARSFTPPQAEAIQPGAVLAEARERLTLSELLS